MRNLFHKFEAEDFNDVIIPLSRYSIHEYIICGVYFLFKEAKLQYIGQSVSVLARVSGHKADGKDFDSFTFIRCAREHLSALEAACIKMFMPPLNGTKIPQLQKERAALVERMLEDANGDELNGKPALLCQEQVKRILGLSGRRLMSLLGPDGANIKPVDIIGEKMWRRADIERLLETL